MSFKKFIIISFILSFVVTVSAQYSVLTETPEPIETAPKYSTGIASIQSNSIQKKPIEIKLNDGNIGYAWNLSSNSSGLGEGPVTINLETNEITLIQQVGNNIIWMTGGDMVQDTWYAASYDGTNSKLYTIDKTTGNYSIVGPMGVSVTGLAFDIGTNTMYASSTSGNTSYLHTVNLLTGATNLIGQITNGIIIGIASGSQGNIFGIKISDYSLYSISASTGNGTLIGSLGIGINFAQDLAYDRDNDILYGTLYNNNGGLYTINTETGAATLVYSFPDQIAGFAIPYTTVNADAPAAVSNLTATAAPQALLEVELNWTNPVKQFDDDPLTELISIVIERNGVVIQTISSPVIGNQETFTDNNIDSPGIYNYRVYGVNSSGTGVISKISVYVGEDVPAAPDNIILTAQGNIGQISWNAPTTGYHNGYFSGLNLTYSLRRMPDNVQVAENITDTEFTDQTVPGVGLYYYIVTASNSIGTGGNANSNELLLAAENVVYYEPFNYVAGTMPPGWTVQLLGEANWSIQNINSSGGRSPEMRLTTVPNFNGASRLVSSSINVTGQSELKLNLRQAYRHYSNSVDLAIKISFDSGQSWESIWSVTTSQNLFKDLYEFYIIVPENADSMHIGFEFTGSTGHIWGWYLDDIIMQTVAENDLRAAEISGNPLPEAGVETTYTVHVKNAGKLQQSDYQVKLMLNDGTELASVAGQPINFAETIQFELNWTPNADHVGENFLYGYVQLQNDEVLSNNTTGVLETNVQPAGNIQVSIGDGNRSLGQPANFFFSHSISQTIYYNHEIGISSGILNALQYTYSFINDGNAASYKIWIGETNSNDLTNGWISLSEMTLVYDGSLYLPEGLQNIYIELDDPYVYSGRNLVIYTIKSNDEYASSQTFLNTADPGSNRSRRTQRNDLPYNPENPGIEGTLNNDFPNISMFFSVEGTGTLEGIVTDGAGPLEGVSIHLLENNLEALTNNEGKYEFLYLPSGTYTLNVQKTGFEAQTIEGVLIEENQTTIQNFQLTPLDQYSVMGSVQVLNGQAVSGANVKLSGTYEYQSVTNDSGQFEINSVYVGNYILTVEAIGYETYVTSISVSGNTDLGMILLTDIILLPGRLNVIVDGQNNGNALLTWMLGDYDEFRYDDGVPAGQLGYPNGTTNSVFGAVHNIHAQINEISWFLTTAAGNQPIVQVWILGLKTDGTPDRTNILHHNTSVPNISGEWNTYELAEPITSNGFFIGISANGFLSLAKDDAIGEPWEFIPQTQFAVFNISNQNSAFTDVANISSPGSFLLRAYGFQQNSATDFQLLQNEPLYEKMSFETKNLNHQNLINRIENKAERSRSFIGFNVFLNDIQVATAITETQYLFENLVNGYYVAGVQSVYSSGVSEIVNIGFTIGEPPFPVTFAVADLTNSFDNLHISGEMTNPQWAVISLTEGNNNIWSVTLDILPGTYDWTIGYIDGNGNNITILPEGDVLSFTINDAGLITGDIDYTITQVGLDDFTLDQVSIFPIPSNDIINIRSNFLMKEVRIYDISGRIVFSENEKGNACQIDVKSYKEGIYIVKILTEKGTTGSKFSIVRQF
jgi:hypothetical protein